MIKTLNASFCISVHVIENLTEQKLKVCLFLEWLEIAHHLSFRCVLGCRVVAVCDEYCFQG